MKLQDIKEGENYAAKVPADYGRQKVVKQVRVTSVLANLREVWVMSGHSFKLTPQAIIAPWSEYVVERDHDAAIRMDRDRDARIEYDQRQADKRARYEADILPAFKRLPTSERQFISRPRGTSDPGFDLADVIEDVMVRGGSMSITLYEDDLAAIAARIQELEAIASQNALTENDLAQAGWAVTAEQERLTALEERLAAVKRAEQAGF